MNCKEFEKNIPDFIAGKLDFQTLQEFGEHMQGGIGDSVPCNGRYAASGRRRCF